MRIRQILRAAMVVVWALVGESTALAVENLPSVPARLPSEILPETISLTQLWQFKVGDDLSWANPDYDDSAWQQMLVPQRWPDGGFPETEQMAWYRLTLKVGVPYSAGSDVLPLLGIRMGKVMSAYELYAGGVLIGGVGRVQPPRQMQYDRQRVLSIPARAVGPDGSVSLSLRVWGGEQGAVEAWFGGPYEGEFQLGSYSRLLNSIIVREVPAMIAVVLFLGFGLYHLYLYHRNRQLNLFLWFGLMAINIGIYCLTLSQWKYLLGWSFISYQKLEFTSIHLLPAVSIQMLWVVLGQRIGPLLRIYQLSFVALAIIVAAAPGLEVHYQTLPLWHVWTLPLMIFGPFMLVRDARAGNREARTMLPGSAIFAMACMGDIYLHYTGNVNWQLIPFGFGAIALSMAVSLANHFTTMLNSLEEEVIRRTADLSEANLQLAEAARADPLTGLLNRRGFQEEASMEVQRFYRNGRPFSLVMGDVDNFKRFNDKYGHACGDYVLKRISAIFDERLRDVDRAARWGGEEFILLLPETDTQGAAVLADKMRKIVEASVFHFEGESIGTTITLGVATFRKDETLEQCIARSDTAMYHGKKAGRNKVMLGGYKGLTLVN